jgi:hypothetical protein
MTERHRILDEDQKKYKKKIVDALSRQSSWTDLRVFVLCRLHWSASPRQRCAACNAADAHP